MSSQIELFGGAPVQEPDDEPDQSMETLNADPPAPFGDTENAKGNPSTTATAPALDVFTPALHSLVSALNSLAPALSALRPALTRLAPALNAITNAMTPSVVSKPAEPTFLGLPLELQIEIYRFYFESLDPPQIHHVGRLLVVPPGPRPFCFSKGHETLLGLTGRGRRMADLNAMYQMWCADDRKMEHIFHFEISDFLPFGNFQDMTAFSGCKRFTVTCLFSEESFATLLTTRRDFLQAINLLKLWVYRLPDTAEHIEIYFEHEKVGPGGVSLGPQYWDMFLQSYGLDLGQVLFDQIFDDFETAPKINHIKTLIFSCGENYSLCPEIQYSLKKKNRTHRPLTVIPNELYPVHKTYLESTSCPLDSEVWNFLIEFRFPGVQKDLHAADWFAISQNEREREMRDSGRRHEEEMPPYEYHYDPANDDFLLDRIENGLYDSDGDDVSLYHETGIDNNTKEEPTAKSSTSNEESDDSSKKKVPPPSKNPKKRKRQTQTPSNQTPPKQNPQTPTPQKPKRQKPTPRSKENPPKKPSHPKANPNSPPPRTKTTTPSPFGPAKGPSAFGNPKTKAPSAPPSASAKAKAKAKAKTPPTKTKESPVSERPRTLPTGDSDANEENVREMEFEGRRGYRSRRDLGEDGDMTADSGDGDEEEGSREWKDGYRRLADAAVERLDRRDGRIR